MSNVFKSNSRFAVLADETSTNVFNKKDKSSRDKHAESETKKNSNLCTYNGFNTFNNNDNRSRVNINRDFESIKSKELRRKKEKETDAENNRINETIKEKIKENSLAVNNFPDLLGNYNIKKSEQKLLILQGGFIDKVKIVKPVISVNTIVNHIKPGWVEIKQDPKTRTIITTSNPIPSYNNNTVNVLQTLVALHKKRTEDYIDLWCYDIWENMFLFQSYDYEYFDKLDEEYEEEMGKLRNENENEIDSENY